MFCLMKLQLYISSLTNRKMIDTVVMCLGCLCSLTLLTFYIYFLFYGNFRCTTKSKGLSRTNRMEKIYFHKKRLKCIPSNWKILNQLWNSMMNIFLQFVITQQIFCLHLMSLKCFKTIFQDTEKKMIEIMEKKWKIISGL